MQNKLLAMLMFVAAPTALAQGNPVRTTAVPGQGGQRTMDMPASMPAPPKITVDTTNDVVDFGGLQQVADLPGPDGRVSFREACTAANNTSGPQTIAFAIPEDPGEEWSGGVATLFMDFLVFVLSDDETTVDFTTQTAFTGDTNPLGNEVGIRVSIPAAGAPAIYVSGDRCVIKGLDRVTWGGYGVELAGNDNRVVGCTIAGPLFAGVYINGPFGGPPATGNIVGGTGPGEGNVLSAGNSGVRIDGPAVDNVVIGNTLSGSFYGAEIRSATCCPGNEAINNRIGGPTVAERNVIRGAGKFGEEGFPDGGQIAVQYSLNTIVEGNYVGVNADGTSVPPTQRGPVGVEVRSSPGTVVRNNVVSGILVNGVNHYAGQRFGTAVKIMGDCSGTTVQGNLIGVDASGTNALPNRRGIEVVYWSVDGSPVTPGPILLGGTQPGQPNVIANNELAGVRVEYTIQGVQMSRNSIRDNGALGIDLLESFAGGVGNTPNDPGDADSGANGLQNYPVLSSVSTAPGSTTIAGVLDSLATRDFTLEFFSSPACDPSGFGEGEVFLGSTVVTTDVNGLATFNAGVPVEVPVGWVVSATATDALTGNTSEFSACLPTTGSLLLTAGMLRRGLASTWTVTGAAPGALIAFLGSPSSGALPPLELIGTAFADGAGVARLTLPIPTDAPTMNMGMQAVVRRPGDRNVRRSNMLVFRVH